MVLSLDGGALVVEGEMVSSSCCIYETTQKHHLSSVGNKNMMVHIICYHLFHTPSVMRGHRIGW
jgi:hypothetical protein